MNAVTTNVAPLSPNINFGIARVGGKSNVRPQNQMAAVGKSIEQP